MSMLDRKLLRELSHSRGLLLAITSIITVGVMCFVTMQSAYHNLNEARIDYYRQCRMADFWIDLKKAPVSDLEPIAQLPGVTDIRPRIQFSATVALESTPEPINALVVSMPEQRQRVINDIVLRRGSYFTARRDNEVIVGASFAEKHRLHPGQWVHLLLNNRRQELFIVGTAISSEFTYMPAPGAIVPDSERFGVFFIKRRFAEEVFDFEGSANQVVGHLAPAQREHPDDTLRRMETLLESYGVFSTTPRAEQTSNQFLTNEISGLRVFAIFMPGIFLTVAAVVLNVLMLRLIRQQRVVIGTLKALGYASRSVCFHYIKFGMCVGVVGSLAGSLLGYWAAGGMTLVYRQYFEFPELVNGFYPYTHAVGLLVSMACATVGSLYGAWQVLQLAPAEAMRPEPPKRGGRVLVERISLLWNRLSAGWRLAVRGVFRHRLRSLAGLFAAAMGAALLVTGFMMFQATMFLVDFQFEKVMRSEFELGFKDDHGREALDEVRRLPGVDLAEPTLNVACTFSRGAYHRKGTVTGLISGARLTMPHNAAGQRLAIPSHGLMMSRRLAELLHVRPGETVTVTPVKGERRPVEAPVVAIADGYLGLTVYAEIEYLSRQVGETFVTNGAQLLTDQDPQQRRRLYQELNQLPGVQSIIARREIAANLRKTMLENQTVFIGVLILFAGIMFFGSILNASLVSLAERSREVATFRALGYTPRQVGGMFLRESLLINTLGTLLGLPVGYLFAMLSVSAYENDVIRIPLVSSWWNWVVTLLLSFLFAMLAHAVVQRNISQMNILESLKVKE